MPVAQDSLYVESGYTESGYFGIQRNASATLQIGSYTEADYVATDYFEDFGTRGSFATLTIVTGTTHLATATLNSAATVSATATRQHNAGATLNSAATVFVTALRQRTATGSISASATISASGVCERGATATLNATASTSVTVEVQRLASATLNNTASQTVRGDVEYSASATLQGAFAYIGNVGLQHSITESNNKAWEYENRTWQTYWGQVWGRPTFVIAAESDFSARASLAKDSRPVSFDTTATMTVVANKGETTPATATLNSTASVSAPLGVLRGQPVQLDNATQFTGSGVVAFGGPQNLTATTNCSATAILEIAASANLIASTALDILTNAEAALTATTSLFGIPNANRGISLTLQGVGSQSVISFKGETTPASATLDNTVSVHFVGNYIKRNVQANLTGISSTLAIGQLITFDPYREYNIEQETRTLKVTPETGVFLLDKENRVNTVIQETNGLLVPQETRRLGIPISTYTRRRELA